MNDAAFTPTERSRIRRLPNRGSHEKAVIYEILDQGILCHVGLATERGPVIIPMGYARRGDELLLHGSAKSRLLNEMAAGAEVSVAVTLLDALVLARSTFHHSMNYRSVVLFGRAEAIRSPEEKRKALDALVEHLVPGRSRDARAANDKELAATLVVRVPIREASAKRRTGPPVDDASDLALDIWAGLIPFERHVGDPIPDEHVGEGIEVPDYVRSYPGGRS